MKSFLEKFITRTDRMDFTERLSEEEHLRRQVNALFNLLTNILGSDRVVLKAGKLEALNLMRSDIFEERVLALQRIVFEDPTIDTVPTIEEVPKIVDDIEDEIADLIARRSVEDKLEKKISEKMQLRHEEYVKEIKMQIIKETAGPENAQTLKKLAVIEKMEQKKLSQSAIETLRPDSFQEIVGQDRAIKSLMSKLACPFPQHIILYGPPGVGKTTAARLALKVAKKLKGTPFEEDAPFVEVDGTTLRWDPRDVTNPLLGSVHDPIYQGARRDLADTGIPEPKLGLVTEAHGGVMFIDEIGELDPMLQNKLLKVLEDKRVSFDSAYYDPDDTNVPQYIKKLFEEGAPADFILIGATTRDPADINPAIRSRCTEVYFEPLTPREIEKIVREAAKKLDVLLDDNIPEMISEYTIEGRKAINILAEAYGMALYKRQGIEEETGESISIQVEDVLEVIQVSRLSPYVLMKGSPVCETGKVFGLGVHGFVGSVLEIEAVAFPAQKEGKGSLRFNDTAGSMAKDSVFNAASVIRRLSGEEISNYDIHVNIIGGGRIDGPSAGMAITAAVLSAIQDRPLRQDLAVTGEISIQGRVKAVGGVFEKIYGAKQAGMTKVIVPMENKKDIPTGLKGIEVILVDTADEALEHMFESHLLS
ncbi:MAG: ATP-dependent protease, Lon family [Firmicutes bacterium HGW-Firmicutes-14]|nr:MAG: ATP-dependent protease, Lon family [Firmicutes bacterium HGW-Firmicutes-14]